MTVNCKIVNICSLAPARRVHIVTLLDHKAVNVCFLISGGKKLMNAANTTICLLYLRMDSASVS